MRGLAVEEVEEGLGRNNAKKKVVGGGGRVRPEHHSGIRGMPRFSWKDSFWEMQV